VRQSRICEAARPNIEFKFKFDIKYKLNSLLSPQASLRTPTKYKFYNNQNTLQK